MKSAVLKGAGEMEVQEIPRPDPVADEVLIEVKYCGICGSDVEIFETGIFPKSSKYGHQDLTDAEGMILGHEFTGVVKEKGDKVDGWEVGDRVVVNPNSFCRNCHWCENSLYNLCPEVNKKGIGLGSPGGFAEFVIVKDYMLRKLPDNVSFKEGTLTEPFSTPLHAVNISNAGVGDSAVVLGAGTIGLFTVLALNISGVSPIFVSEFEENKRRLAEDYGAELAVNPSDIDITEFLETKTEIGADKVFECIGNPETFKESTEIVKRGGEIYIIGIPGESVEFFPAVWIQKEIGIKTIYGYTHEFDTALNILSKDEFSTDPIISDVVPLDNIVEDGFESKKKSSEKIKVLVKP